MRAVWFIEVTWSWSATHGDDKNDDNNNKSIAYHNIVDLVTDYVTRYVTRRRWTGHAAVRTRVFGGFRALQQNTVDFDF